MDIKKAYQLWWEYLKLNDKYRELCSFYGRYLQSPSDLKIEKPPLSKLLKNMVEAKTLPVNIAETYSTFGDVYNVSFEDFWELRGKYLKVEINEPLDAAVFEFKEFILLLFAMCENDYMQNEGREPTLNEFKPYLSEFMTNPYRILAINLTKPLGEIDKGIKAIINKKEKLKLGKTEKVLTLLSCRNRRPTPNLRYEEVKRYLEVLKVFKIDKLKGRAAFNKVNPKGDYDVPDSRTVFYSDKRKAERILSNAAFGYFPGPYQGCYTSS